MSCSFDAERRQLEAISKGSRRMLIQDFQYSGPGTNIVASAQSLSATSPATFRLNELTFPAQTIFILPRWSEDLARRTGGACGAATGVKGYQPWNLNGWYNPGGAAANRSIIDRVELRVTFFIISLFPVTVLNNKIF